MPDERSTVEARDTILENDRPILRGGSIDAFGDLGPGSQLGGRYLVESVIGKGATGVVFEASHLVIGKRVALKCLYPQHASNPTIVERFFREARIAATVEHPNVIQVFDGGKEGEVLFLAMERLEGESLGARLMRGPMRVNDAVTLFLAFMDGVAAVHARGVVHRDLKPDNIFLADQRAGVVPKVLDFGISKLKEPGLKELTSLGTVMGTPFYMAPEQVTNTRDVDARADVYSLGVMLFEALTGDVPFADDSVLGIFKRVQAGDTTWLDRLRDEVPEPLVKVVETAMRVDRARRFASVTEMRDALASATPADTDPVTERPYVSDSRETVKDARSPLAQREIPTIVRGTAPLPPAEPSAVPLWVWWALGAAGAVTFVSVVVALLALVS